MPPSALARARDVLQRLERYELDVFAEHEAEPQIERAASATANESRAANDQALTKATTIVGRRRLAAQSSLFDLANQKAIDRLRESNADTLSPEEAKQLLIELRKQLI